MLLFLPGIIATFIIDSLVHIRQKAPFRYGVYAILNGLGVYLVLELITWVVNCPSQFPSLSIWGMLADPAGTINSGSEVVSSAALAVPYGLVVSALGRKKLLHRFAKFCRVSDKFGDNTVWEHLLTSADTDWVTVRDTTRDLAYQGKIFKYSDGTTEFELCLSQVNVYRNSDMKFFYYVDYIYLTSDSREWLLEFNFINGV